MCVCGGGGGGGGGVTYLEQICQLLLLTENYIADWCSNDRRILATSLFFCGKAISFNFIADLYIFSHI